MGTKALGATGEGVGGMRKRHTRRRGTWSPGFLTHLLKEGVKEFALLCRFCADFVYAIFFI